MNLILIGIFILFDRSVFSWALTDKDLANTLKVVPVEGYQR